jgi:hypothetical protein
VGDLDINGANNLSSQNRTLTWLSPLREASCEEISITELGVIIPAAAAPLRENDNGLSRI